MVFGSAFYFHALSSWASRTTFILVDFSGAQQPRAFTGFRKKLTHLGKVAFNLWRDCWMVGSVHKAVPFHFFQR